MSRLLGLVTLLTLPAFLTACVPGGRRFHFTDPSGNEFAVWSE